jgi:GrpB-like predicted nucleotidyltransferase (UPF0157 family)/uncharacterized RDD family membrane protein YckC
MLARPSPGWRRVVAVVVDYGLVILCLGVLAVVGVFSYAIGAVTTTIATPTGRVLAQLVIFAVLTVPVTVWLAGWEASPGGATPGKRLLGLRVLTMSGDRLTWPRSLLRTALKFTLPWELAHIAWWNLLLRSGDQGSVLDRLLLSLVCAAIAVYLVSLFVGSRRAPYDRIAGAFVIANGGYRRQGRGVTMSNLIATTDAGATAAPQPPIGRYRRLPVQIHQADPDAPEVARRLIALIATRWPATPAEHVGSTAVPGLAGKGIIDLLLAAEPAQVPAITQALHELGFQPQVPAAFPPSRPMLWGAFRHGPTEYRVHVHVVPADSPEVTAMRGLRDALRADPVLRRRYAALKRAIVAGGPADPVAFTRAKHDWIAATLAHLGLAGQQPRRLYQDDLDPDNPDRLASWPIHLSLVQLGP